MIIVVIYMKLQEVLSIVDKKSKKKNEWLHFKKLFLLTIYIISYDKATNN